MAHRCERAKQQLFHPGIASEVHKAACGHKVREIDGEQEGIARVCVIATDLNVALGVDERR